MTFDLTFHLLRPLVDRLQDEAYSPFIRTLWRLHKIYCASNLNIVVVLTPIDKILTPFSIIPPMQVLSLDFHPHLVNERKPVYYRHFHSEVHNVTVMSNIYALPVKLRNKVQHASQHL